MLVWSGKKIMSGIKDMHLKWWNEKKEGDVFEDWEIMLKIIFKKL
jgi:hypothetical protein